MNRTNPGRSRDAAIATIDTTPGGMLDAIIERGEAVRTGYLARLSEPHCGARVSSCIGGC